MTTDPMSIQDETQVQGIVILTHGKAGEELIRSAEMIIGKMEKVIAVSLGAGEDPSDYRARVSKVLATMPRGSILMTDLFGGTPSNTAAALSKNCAVFAVSGVNLPMLIEAVNLRQVLTGEELVRAIEAAGRDGVKNVLDVLRQQAD